MTKLIRKDIRAELEAYCVQHPRSVGHVSRAKLAALLKIEQFTKDEKAYINEWILYRKFARLKEKFPTKASALRYAETIRAGKLHMQSWYRSRAPLRMPSVYYNNVIPMKSGVGPGTRLKSQTAAV